MSGTTLESSLRERTRILERVACGAELGETLSDIVRLAEARFADGRCAIWLLDEKRAHLQRGSAPRLPETFLAAFERLALGPVAGSCGAAIERKAPVALADVASGPLCTVSRTALEQAGLFASASVPILSSQDAVLGTLAIYFGAVRETSPSEIEALQSAARLAALAIERSRAEAELRLREDRLTLAARGLYDGLWDWSLTTNRIYFSPDLQKLLGFEAATMEASPAEWFDRMHPDDLGLVKARLVCYVQGATAGYESEYRIRRQDGSWRFLRSRAVAVRDASGRAVRLVGTEVDITEEKQRDEDLPASAIHDPVTGLPNRTLFLDLLCRKMSPAGERRGPGLAILLLDLDRFKVVNESLGPSAGDQMLAAIARRLERCVRPEDVVARVGGDEFGILLNDIGDVEGATRVAERVQGELALPFNVSGQVVYTTASIGIALDARPYERPEYLLRDADTALYRAKAQGRAQHLVFETGMHVRAVALQRLDSDLRRALNQQEFYLEYQPVVSLSTGSIAGFEALARWAHPEQGLVPPDDFIPVAEETGIIVPLGWLVLREACRQMQEWRERFPDFPPYTISVNVSAKQLGQAGLVEGIEQILRDTELDPACLKLEITESVIMENAERGAAVLQELKGLKVRLHLDDFGTGYSSLSYLHQLPLDALKIDRSFVSKIGKEEGKFEIVRTILKLGQSLGMDLIAEGLETPEQLVRLRALDCHYGQGYYFSKPLSASEAEHFFREAPPWLERMAGALSAAG
jgi:diguanylate cyclase (GGDEF)-like protein/PAS domain S-box-containing protein